MTRKRKFGLPLALDALTGTGMCGSNPPPSGQQAGCGFGPRLPLLIVSPYSRRNFVDGTTTSQSSVPKFIEDNWLGAEFPSAR